MNPIRISASRLGEILEDDICQRCYWLKLRLNHHMPFDIFPGIFSSIDSYTKDIVRSWFDVHGMPPHWLSPLGPITGYEEPKSWREFQTTDHEYGINLRGEADAIFKYPDSSYLIVDYKTARFGDPENKKLMPRYQVQLNAYARIAADCGPAPISHLALIYLEPATKGHAPNYCDNCREDGFVMGFQARVVDVPLDAGLLTQAMARTRALFEKTDAPDGAPGCEDCNRIRELAEHLWPGVNWSEIDDVDLLERLQRSVANLRPKGKAPRQGRSPSSSITTESSTVASTRRSRNSRLAARMPTQRPTRTRHQAVALRQSAEQETLVCFDCGKHWQRPRSRGRRPGRCPECAAKS